MVHICLMKITHKTHPLRKILVMKASTAARPAPHNLSISAGFEATYVPSAATAMLAYSPATAKDATPAATNPGALRAPPITPRVPATSAALKMFIRDSSFWSFSSTLRCNSF